MFPTAGYFKGVDCPFYKEGTCHRPYCHYKHAKLKVQPSLRQPTRLLHTSNASRKNQISYTKPDVKSEHVSQLHSSDNTKDSLVQQEIISSAFTVKNQPPSKKDNEALTKADQASVAEKEIKQEFQTELTTEGSKAIHSDVQSDTQLIIGEKEHYMKESEYSDNNVVSVSSYVKDDHYKHVAYSKFTHEDQNSSTIVNRSLRDVSTHTGDVKEKLSSTMTVPPQECERQYSETVEGTVSVSSVSCLSQSSSKDELPLHDEVSYKVDDENVMFEELFGSSGEEAEHNNDDNIIEGAVYDNSDDEMELGVAYREVEQRKAEEEFKRITTHSTDTQCVSATKPSYENLGIKNKRQAHGNAELMRHGGVTVGRPKVKTTSTMNPLLNDPSGIYAGKKRKAHEQPSSSGPDVATAPAPKRPRLLVSMNAKIPTALRQNFLDSFIDEYLKFCTVEEAYKKGLDDEQGLFKKANNKMLYMNLSSIALKRLRERASKEQPCSNLTMKKTSPPVSKRQNTTSAATSNRVSAQERKAKKVEEVTKPPSGTYYLDEIFKTTVSVEMHQKNKPHSSTNLEGLTRVGNLDDNTLPNEDHHGNTGEVRHTSKARRPLSFDSALQKMDRKLVNKKEQPKVGSPSAKKQLASGRTTPTTQSTNNETSSSPSRVITRPTSAQVQKLIDKGYAKVKIKSNAELSSHPTNRIPVKHNKSTASGVKLPNLAGHQSEQSKGKSVRQISVRQISVSKSSPLTSPVGSSVSDTTTPTTATSSMISAVKFYSSKVFKSEKIKVNIKSNPASTATSSKAEKHSTSSPNYSILKKKEVVLTDEIFIQYMHSYLLTEEQLVENGYPRPTGDPGVASIVRKPDDVSDIKAVGPNAQRHTCCRCGKPFIIYNSGSYQSTEECCYHSKRLQKKREYGEGVISYYPCCQGNRGSSGCQIAKMHVTKGAKLPLESGYVQTSRHPNINHYIPTVYALDCEMCYTTAGLELTRVSVVGTNNESVYESLVKPDYPVVDYNTKFSGIIAQDLVSVTTTLKDVQNDLLNLFYEDTILLGHSLESDLRSLKIIHSCVVDTALVFPHRMGLPYKRALRNITAEFLHKIIQDEVDGGHDSKEDAIACMDLMKWKIKSDLQKTTRRGSVT